MFLATENLDRMGGIVALPVLPFIYVALCVGVTRARRRRESRRLDGCREPGR